MNIHFSNESQFSDSNYFEILEMESGGFKVFASHGYIEIKRDDVTVTQKERAFHPGDFYNVYTLKEHIVERLLNKHTNIWDLNLSYISREQLEIRLEKARKEVSIIENVLIS